MNQKIEFLRFYHVERKNYLFYKFKSSSFTFNFEKGEKLIRLHLHPRRTQHHRLQLLLDTVDIH
mgnify:CR=1 FL=1